MKKTWLLSEDDLGENTMCRLQAEGIKCSSDVFYIGSQPKGFDRGDDISSLDETPSSKFGISIAVGWVADVLIGPVFAERAQRKEHCGVVVLGERKMDSKERRRT